MEQMQDIIKNGSSGELIEVMKELKADVNKFESGVTPLLFAVMNGTFDMVKALVEFGADVSLADYNHRTPLWLAAQKNHLKITQFLLESGAELEIGDIWDSRSPLWIATSMGHTDIMGLLIEAGADLNHPNKDGTTPLSFACYNRDIVALNLLVFKGADFNQADAAGNTPLQLARRYNFGEVIKILNAAEARRKLQPAAIKPQSRGRKYSVVNQNPVMPQSRRESTREPDAHSYG